MAWFQWMAVIALGVCLIALLLHFLRLIRLGKPYDLSKPAESAAAGIRYAFTGAMSPRRKESAYLHLPTYTAGLFYHTGTFLSFFLFFFILLEFLPKGWLAIAILILLVASASCGLAILIKRIVKKELYSLSNPDDFISNILVTLFQILTILLLINIKLLPSYSPPVIILYYLSFTLLMLYVPVSKLRHLIYFFAARYHLGVFYGRRGVWPLHQKKS